MANLGATFDATTVDPATGFELLPPAKYVVQIVSSEMRPTKDGGGQYLWLELDVLEGPLSGRKLFDRLNLVNASAQTVEIAQRTLSAICHATGRMQVQDSAGAAPDPDDRRRDGPAAEERLRREQQGALPAARARRRGAAAPAVAGADRRRRRPARPSAPAGGFASAPWKR